MSCSSPGLIKQKDGRMYLVPCRGAYCEQCIKDRVNEWSDRLAFDIISHGQNRSAYVTLTYDDEHIPLTDKSFTLAGIDYPIATFDYSHIQKFNYNLRQRLKNKYKNQYRMIVAAEYGEELYDEYKGYKILLGRPHYHIMLSGVDYDRDYIDIIKSWQNRCMPYAIKVLPITAGCVNYCLEYNFKASSNKWISNYYKERGLQVPFQKFSKKIGYEYFDSIRHELMENGGFYYRKGQKKLAPKSILDRYMISHPDNSVDPQHWALRRNFEDSKKISNFDYKESKKCSDWLKKPIDRIKASDYISYRRAMGAHHENTIAHFNAMYK